MVGEGGLKRLEYDPATPDGAAALELIATLKAAKTGDVSAPWRQTVGAGGSEFGKPKWFAALKRAFPPLEGQPPVFRLWQLALADVVVRL